MLEIEKTVINQLVSNDKLTTIHQALKELQADCFLIFLVFNDGSIALISNSSELLGLKSTETIHVATEKFNIFNVNYSSFEKAPQSKQSLNAWLKKHGNSSHAHFLFRDSPECYMTLGLINYEKNIDYSTASTLEQSHFFSLIMDCFCEVIANTFNQYRYSFILTEPEYRNDIIMENHKKYRALNPEEIICLMSTALEKSKDQIKNQVLNAHMKIESRFTTIKRKLHSKTTTAALLKAILYGYLGSFNQGNSYQSKRLAFKAMQWIHNLET